MEPVIIISLALFISIIGALPFGLVNLSVLDTSYRQGPARAMHLSGGAAIIEVAYGLTALTAGGLIAHFIRTIPVLYYLVLAVPAVVGIFFLLKGRDKQAAGPVKKNGFLRGMVLNLVSIQVLLYWLIAMTYLHTLLEIEYSVFNLALFALGIWLGKMGVLWLYALLSRKIFSSMGILSRNINRVIGAVLLFTVLLQLVL
ncbi:MAG: hypothetical protein RQ743_12450 [Bacteroidales bacterium]|nr:hypothetical protein [Bacteroidales bacterium]